MNLRGCGMTLPNHTGQAGAQPVSPVTDACGRGLGR